VPAAISGPATIIDCAPGNTVTVSGSGFGTSGSLLLSNQGADGSSSTVVSPASWSDTAVSFAVPDGALTGALTLTAQDSTQATVGLRVGSQYVQSYEYVGEGVDVSSLAPGELDVVLRRASAYADAYIGFPMRIMQVLERHPWRTSRRVYPFSWPTVSVDKFVIRISPTQIATIDPASVVINATNKYVEVLSYAVASYALLGAIQNLGLVANIVELTHTRGYTQMQYPQALRAATVMIATELLSYRNIQAKGFGGFASVKQGQQAYDRRQEEFAIPKPAMELLAPFRLMRLQ
jgi:hypothetical protein